MKWKSCAEWPPGHVHDPEGSNITKDTHNTEEQARAVSRMLSRQGWGGQGAPYPIRVWVEKES